MPITAFERPPYPAPHSFLVLVVFTLIICMVLDIFSLVLGIPALVFSLSVSVICNYDIAPFMHCRILFLPLSQSVHAVEKKQWKAAKSYGKIALYLSIANWIYVLGAALLAMGLTMGFLSKYVYYYY